MTSQSPRSVNLLTTWSACNDTRVHVTKEWKSHRKFSSPSPPLCICAAALVGIQAASVKWGMRREAWGVRSEESRTQSGPFKKKSKKKSNDHQQPYFVFLTHATWKSDLTWPDSNWTRYRLHIYVKISLYCVWHSLFLLVDLRCHNQCWRTFRLLCPNERARRVLLTTAKLN